jgi:hypothetical protein
MNKKEKDEVIIAAKELYDIVNNNRVWQKIMFGECPEDEIDDKLKNFKDKYQKWSGETK